jgi:hypothetical protein
MINIWNPLAAPFIYEYECNKMKRNRKEKTNICAIIIWNINKLLHEYEQRWCRFIF